MNGCSWDIMGEYGRQSVLTCLRRYVLGLFLVSLALFCKETEVADRRRRREKRADFSSGSRAYLFLFYSLSRSWYRLLTLRRRNSTRQRDEAGVHEKNRRGLAWLCCDDFSLCGGRGPGADHRARNDSFRCHPGSRAGAGPHLSRVLRLGQIGADAARAPDRGRGGRQRASRPRHPDRGRRLRRHQPRAARRARPRLQSAPLPAARRRGAGRARARRRPRRHDRGAWLRRRASPGRHRPERARAAEPPRRDRPAVPRTCRSTRAGRPCGGRRPAGRRVRSPARRRHHRQPHRPERPAQFRPPVRRQGQHGAAERRPAHRVQGAEPGRHRLRRGLHPAGRIRHRRALHALPRRVRLRDRGPRAVLAAAGQRGGSHAVAHRGRRRLQARPVHHADRLRDDRSEHQPVLLALLPFQFRPLHAQPACRASGM